MHLVMGIGHKAGLNMTQAALREGVGDDRSADVFTEKHGPGPWTLPLTTPHPLQDTLTLRHTQGINMIFLSFL